MLYTLIIVYVCANPMCGKTHSKAIEFNAPNVLDDDTIWEQENDSTFELLCAEHGITRELVTAVHVVPKTELMESITWGREMRFQRVVLS